MGSEYTFYDYVDADGMGSNMINDWLNDGGRDAKAGLNAIIRHLEATPPALWSKPIAYPLHNEWRGFWELRKKIKRVPYRLIGKMEGREILLVTWGFHKGRWRVEATVQTAKERVEQMIGEPVKYRREHDFS